MSRPDPHDLAAARACIKGVTDRLAAREGSSLPDPATIAAAVSIFAESPDHREISVSIHPTTVWRISGHLVAVHHFGSHDGPVIEAECSCLAEGLCEHILVALAEPGSPASTRLCIDLDAPAYCWSQSLVRSNRQEAGPAGA